MQRDNNTQPIASGVLAYVAPGKHITRTGNLIIDGDVGSRAKIDVTDGVLIIKGNVHWGARITVQFTRPIFSTRITIHGSVKNLVCIKTEDQVNIIGDLGDSCEVISEQSGLNVRNVGCDTTISTYKDIHAQDIESGCQINSIQGGVTIEKNVGDGTHITAHADIVIEGDCSEDAVLHSASGQVHKGSKNKLK